MTNANLFFEIFWSKSIQNRSKRILKRKYRFWKFYPNEFFLDVLPLISKNSGKQEKFDFYIGFDSEGFKPYSKTKT